MSLQQQFQQIIHTKHYLLKTEQSGFIAKETVDFYLSAIRNQKVAKRFLSKT